MLRRSPSVKLTPEKILKGQKALGEINVINRGKSKLDDQTILDWIREGRR